MDRIERDVLIAAPIDRVWDLITNPEHVGRWFGDAGAEIELRPGGAFALSWQDHGTVHGRVEAVEPPRRFAWRWLAQFNARIEPTPANSTLTEFVLSAEGDGTRVAVVESGFEDLDVDVEQRTAALANHTQGWAKELAALAAYAGAVPAQR